MFNRGELGGSSFFMPSLKKHPEAIPMVQLVRLHAYKQGVLNLVHVPQKEAKKRRLELLQDGYTIAHSELL